MNFTHVRPLAPLVWSPPSVPSLSPILADRKSCSASAVGGFQTPALSSETDSVGQDLLDLPTPLLVFVEDGAHGGKTVVRWHRLGFQLYWRFLSHVRKPVGRRPVTREIRDLIFRMVAENPTWRAPRIHGELVMLGFAVSERSVSRWMRRAPRPYEPGQRWLAFLHIIARPSPPWISSPCRHSRSTCCMSSS